MTKILTNVTIAGLADVPNSDRGDFTCRRAVDISSSTTTQGRAEKYRVYYTGYDVMASPINITDSRQGIPDRKAYEANMELIWGWQDPGRPRGGPMDFAIWGDSQFAQHFCIDGHMILRMESRVQRC